MCGIVGFLKSELREKEYESILQRMSNNIAHRGPDDDGYYHGESISLGSIFITLSSSNIKRTPEPIIAVIIKAIRIVRQE